MVRSATPSRRELVQTLKEKADVVGLAYNDLAIKRLDSLRDSPLIHRFERYGIGMEDSTLVLYVSDPGLLNVDFIGYELEYLVCQQKIVQDGILAPEILTMGEKEAVIHALEINKAYRNHFASKYTIAYFGMEHLTRVHMKDLQEFVNKLNGELEITRKWEDGMIIVAALYKEQMRNDLLDADPGIIPDIVKDITAPFAPGFELISESGFDWTQKSILLLMMSNYVLTNINAPQSYMDNQLIYTPTLDDITTPLAKKGMLYKGSVSKSKEIEKLMRQIYEQVATNS